MKFLICSIHNQVWGDKLLACWEAGLPHALDPETLETLGSTSLGGFCELGPVGRGQPVDLGAPTLNSAMGLGGTGNVQAPPIEVALALLKSIDRL